MISRDLTRTIREQLLARVASGILDFDADASLLCVVREIEHPIDTGGARPLRQGSYRVSTSRRQTIKSDVAKSASARYK